eukprot:m.289074 g.289074  ORF g.289074 m.289074 type:complete len:155 (-) comp15806_c0_seq12:248-712(-)
MQSIKQDQIFDCSLVVNTLAFAMVSKNTYILRIIKLTLTPHKHQRSTFAKTSSYLHCDDGAADCSLSCEEDSSNGVRESPLWKNSFKLPHKRRLCRIAAVTGRPIMSVFGKCVSLTTSRISHLVRCTSSNAFTAASTFARFPTITIGIGVQRTS